MGVQVRLGHPDRHAVIRVVRVLEGPLVAPRGEVAAVIRLLVVQLAVAPLGRRELHRRVADTPLREPLLVFVGALVAGAAVGVADVLLALPLRDLCVLLDVRQGVEAVGGEAEGLRYSEVALMLGE